MERIAVRLPKFDCLIGKSIIASSVEHPNMRFAFCSAALPSRRPFVSVYHRRLRRESKGPSRSLRSKASRSRRTRRRARKSPRTRSRPSNRPRNASSKRSSSIGEAAAKLSLSAGSAECVWTGRRITSLLWRDDVDTARRYIDLYDRFGCSAEHLKLTFRCVIRQGPIDPKAADRLAARVHDCWLDPEGTPTAASRSINGSPAKSGTIPN